MCTTCGCGSGEIKVDGQALHSHDDHWHVHEDGTAHSHSPAPAHTGAGGKRYHLLHRHQHSHLHFGLGAARAHAPGLSQSRMIQIEQNILSKNDQYAVQNRMALENRGILALNLVSSPGSGKTSLLVRTIHQLQQKLPIAVIEGDQQTANDAERIRATGAPAVQINTGKGCHLDAYMVGEALHQLELADKTLLFIENVGNLVCPAAFDLGEACKVVILSVTEGEDKPLKYPDMFRAARLMLLNKCDLLPYLDFNVELVIENARRINPAIEIIQLSAATGAGFDAWLAWLAREHDSLVAEKRETMDGLKLSNAELEARLAAGG
ncbi:MAG: hydrogenase accessory protein HypB [Betaproteobacteria bacterium HGW-Betaproteobacteria-21]|nr:MAG: hydrogenase accessory protein HypB [Betaproteobacteria bacterium HGW-Betaproteobacteria-21]